MIYIYGEFNLIDDANENIFAYTRKLNNKTVLVAGNLTIMLHH